jgi:hypothetical protein
MSPKINRTSNRITFGVSIWLGRLLAGRTRVSTSGFVIWDLQASLEHGDKGIGGGARLRGPRCCQSSHQPWPLEKMKSG